MYGLIVDDVLLDYMHIWLAFGELFREKKNQECGCVLATKISMQTSNERMRVRSFTGSFSEGKIEGLFWYIMIAHMPWWINGKYTYTWIALIVCPSKELHNIYMLAFAPKHTIFKIVLLSFYIRHRRRRKKKHTKIWNVEGGSALHDRMAKC